MSIRKLQAVMILLALLPVAAIAADISGNWTASFDTSIGPQVKITYAGKLVSGDEIQFTRDVMGMAKEEIVAKRAK